jgi:hypothetical protein
MSNLRELLKNKEPTIKKLLDKVYDVASIMKEDTVIGARYGGLKLKEFDAYRQKAMKIYNIGTRTLNLYKNGKIRDRATIGLCRRVETLDKIAQRYNLAAKKVGKKIRFTKSGR